MPFIRKYNIYINKELRIRGYFWNPKGIREQNNLGNTGRDETCRTLVVRFVSISARDHLVAAVDGTKVCQYFNKDSVFELFPQTKLQLCTLC
jgi:hypothetical protein